MNEPSVPLAAVPATVASGHAGLRMLPEEALRRCAGHCRIAGLVKSEEDHPTAKPQATMKPIEKQGIGHRLRTEVMSG